MDERFIIKDGGIVTERKCPHCGHLETGYIDKDGNFRPLTSGMIIQVIDRFPERHQLRTPHARSEAAFHSRVWIPPIVMGNKTLRIRYGILLPEDSIPDSITPMQYRRGYIYKIKYLIEKGDEEPLPVLLDRFFTAPHLAGGSPEEVAVSLWEELDEIRHPAILIERWLESRDQAIVMDIMKPFSKDEFNEIPPDNESIMDEFKSLRIEEFFESL